MRDVIQETLSAYYNDLVSLFSRYVSGGKKILQSHHLTDELIESAKEDETMHKLRVGPFFKFLQSTQEAIVLPAFMVIAVRPRPDVWEYFWVNGYELTVDHLSVSEYLQFKEELVDGGCIDNYMLELDFEPFNATFSRPTCSSSIGNGVMFLNRHLSSNMFHKKEILEPLLDFLHAHKHDGLVMMLNDCIQNISDEVGQHAATPANMQTMKIEQGRSYSSKLKLI